MALFDQFAKNYDEGHKKAVALSGFGPDYFHEYKLRELYDSLKVRGLETQPFKMLNLGCGTGNSERYIKKYFPQASVYSVDVSEESIKTAREANRDLPDVTFAPYDGLTIPFDIEFDLVFVANVFHHIPRHQQIDVLKSAFAKLKNGGLLYIFELNPINPLTMWVAIRNDYRFDPVARLLSPMYMRKILGAAGFSKLDVRYTVFFPAAFAGLIPYEKYLAKLPLGAHYYYSAEKHS